MTPEPIRAQLIGSDSCAALGVTINSSSPVLALCRKLVADGYDPALPLEVYRGEILSLRVRSIGEAVGLEVTGNGVGFLRTPKRRRGSPVEFAPDALAIPTASHERESRRDGNRSGPESSHT